MDGGVVGFGSDVETGPEGKPWTWMNNKRNGNTRRICVQNFLVISTLALLQCFFFLNIIMA